MVDRKREDVLELERSRVLTILFHLQILVLLAHLCRADACRLARVRHGLEPLEPADKERPVPTDRGVEHVGREGTDEVGHAEAEAGKEAARFGDGGEDRGASTGRGAEEGASNDVDCRYTASRLRSVRWDSEHTSVHPEQEALDRMVPGMETGELNAALKRR